MAFAPVHEAVLCKLFVNTPDGPNRTPDGPNRVGLSVCRRNTHRAARLSYFEGLGDRTSNRPLGRTKGQSRTGSTRAIGTLRLVEDSLLKRQKYQERLWKSKTNSTSSTSPKDKNEATNHDISMNQLCSFLFAMEIGIAQTLHYDSRLHKAALSTGLGCS